MYKTTTTTTSVKEIATHDNFETTFEAGIMGQMDFTDFLAERAASREWMTVNLYDLAFKNISNGPLFLAEVRKNLELGPEISDEAILSTISDGSAMGMEKGSEFAVATKELSKEKKWQHFLLSDVALNSVALTLIGKTTMFNKLSTENKLEALKVFLTAKEKKPIKMMKCFGKIRTFQSDDKGAKTYSIMNQEELVDTLIDVLDTRFVGSEFEGATYTHNGTYATWSLPEQRDELLETYLDTCHANGVTKMDKFIPAVTFYTSDTGMSAVTVKASLVSGSFQIDIGSAIKLDHMNGHTVKDFRDLLDQLFVQYQDLIVNLQNMLNIKIKHPINCMRNVGEDAKIPATYLEPALELFASVHDEDEEITAHEIFYSLEEILLDMKCAKVAQSTIEKCKENLARTVAKSYNWKSMDKI